MHTTHIQEEEDEGVVWMTDTSAEAVAARAAEQLTSATASMVTQGNIEAEQAKERRRAEKEAKKKVTTCVWASLHACVTAWSVPWSAP